jgi:hypothetical protein
MKLRRETIVPVLALLVIAAAIPFAIVDTLKRRLAQSLEGIGKGPT